MAEKWKLVTPDQMTLELYPCGVRAGDVLKLRATLEIADHRGRRTRKVHPPGERNVVLKGSPDEPNVVWLERPNGEQHTWDETILEAYEKTGERDGRFPP